MFLNLIQSAAICSRNGPGHVTDNKTHLVPEGLVQLNELGPRFNFVGPIVDPSILPSHTQYSADIEIPAGPQLSAVNADAPNSRSSRETGGAKPVIQMLPLTGTL